MFDWKNLKKKKPSQQASPVPAMRTLNAITYFKLEATNPEQETVTFVSCVRCDNLRSDSDQYVTCSVLCYTSSIANLNFVEMCLLQQAKSAR